MSDEVIVIRHRDLPNIETGFLRGEWEGLETTEMLKNLVFTGPQLPERSAVEAQSQELVDQGIRLACQSERIV